MKINYRLLIITIISLSLSFGCEEDDAIDEIGDNMELEEENEDEENEGEENSELPVGAEIFIPFAGEYSVVMAVAGEHDRGTVIIGEDASIDFDTDINFAPADITAVYDRIECCLRIQVSYGADDDGPVINLFLSEGATVLVNVQYRNNNSSIDVQVDVE